MEKDGKELKFLVGKELRSAIKSILSRDGCRCAVAFWGKGANKQLPQDGKGNFKIICNLASGGTNPFEIEKFARNNIRQCDTLHAKVYISDATAIVASSNVSTNGLGLEGVEQAKWIEAGIITRDVSELSDWFDRLWEHQARSIEPADLKRAKKAWKLRQRGRPTLSLADFDTDRQDTPLLFYWGQEAWEVNKNAIREALGDFSPKIKALVDDGLGLEGHEDEHVFLKSEHWVLIWYTDKEGLPKRRPKPYWFYSGRIIPNSFRYKGETKWRPTVISADYIPSEPFDLSAPRVCESFFDVISGDAFKELRTDEDRGAWFTPTRLRKMRDFWPAFKSRYLNATV
jgi:hypothetical protein